MFRYQKLLVPLDGSELAEQAVAPAVTLAKATAAEVIFLRVVPSFLLTIEPNLYREAMAVNENEARAYLKSLRSQFSSAAVTIRTKTLSGPVSESIVSFAEENDIDLIVISSHGRSGVQRWVYGSVAEKVLRQTCCATLVIRGYTQVELFKHRRILVPLDGSSLAEYALEAAVAIAGAMEAELILIRITTPIHLGLETAPMEQAFDNIEAVERSQAEVYLKTVATSLSEHGVPIKLETMSGPVAESIIDYAASHGVDLIAMSSHGRSGISRWVYGSVAEKVLRGASCATLIVRNPQET